MTWRLCAGSGDIAVWHFVFATCCKRGNRTEKQDPSFNPPFSPSSTMAKFYAQQQYVWKHYRIFVFRIQQCYKEADAPTAVSWHPPSRCDLASVCVMFIDIAWRKCSTQGNPVAATDTNACAQVDQKLFLSPYSDWTWVHTSIFTLYCLAPGCWQSSMFKPKRCFEREWVGKCLQNSCYLVLLILAGK